MKSIILVFGILLLLNMELISANGNHEREIEEGRKLVESEVNCDKLSDEQLEAIGEYYMEQMHPGEAHEAMHKLMGMEEGTEYHEQVHVNMARMMYCGEGGMIGMMNMMGGGNMMGSNMMTGSMWGGSWWLWGIVSMLLWIAILIALILLIIWLYKKITEKTDDTDSAFKILKRRFAQGEINKKEYESMKKEICE